MAEATTLYAQPRTVIGRANRRLASSGQVPAVLYGVGYPQGMPIAVDRHDFDLFLAHHSAGSALIALSVEGEKKPVNAMIRDLQTSPIKGTILHIDFLEIAMNKPVHALVALRLVNDPSGVKAGGILTVNYHEVNVEAKPADLPEAIEVDVAGLEVGDSLHISDITPPAGVTLLDDADEVIASVQAPRIEVEEEVVEAEVTEPEVIGEKAEEE